MTDPVDCTTVRAALTGELTRPGLSARVPAHLEYCDDCRRFLAEQRRRPALLRALSPPLSAARAGAILDRLKMVLRGLGDR